MRILVAGPAKTGNVWIEHLLAATYGLRISKPPAATIEALTHYVDSGSFLDGTICHQHFEPTEQFFEVAQRAGSHVVTTIRNPYDTFVSLYFYVQNFSSGFIQSNDRAAEMIGRSIHDRRILDYLKHHFGWHMGLTSRWLQQNQSILVRYEDLHDDAFCEMKRVTDLMSPVHDSVITTAIAASQPDVMKQLSPELNKHIRSARVGDWREHLSEEHLRIFRSFHADAIESSGYTVE